MADETIANRMNELLDKGEAEEGDYLINATVYDLNTLSFREVRELRRVCRDELYDGADEYDPRGVTASDAHVAAAYVFLMREKGLDLNAIDTATLDEALELREYETVISRKPGPEGENDVPPTSPAPSRSSSAKTSTRATGGARSSPTAPHG